ncbi:dystrophin-related protein 2-like [Chanos chanos]|uniref:Dystrophin-related protein 2-like n=1 Tax=Chanos chanos TaxID=29144 RepID=A0A6J2W0P3_CHACN|nr:dystrophin-related protein 2-like [Chanos chanos]
MALCCGHVQEVLTRALTQDTVLWELALLEERYLLQDLTAWLSLKEEELDRPLPIGGNRTTLHHQKQYHQIFEEDLKARGPFVYSVLEAAQEFLSQHTLAHPLLDPLPLDGDLGQSAERWVWRQANLAAGLWERVLWLCSERTRQIDGTAGSVTELQKCMQELQLQLQEAQGVQEAWEPLGDLVIDTLQDHIDATQLFQEELLAIRDDLRHMNELAHQLSLNAVCLPDEHTHTLHHLNTEWRLLKESVEDRLKELQEAFRDFGPESQHFLSGSVQDPWERAISTNRVPYYINHSTQTTSWDHPRMTQLYQTMADLNNIRFSAYRTAMKLRRVQKALKLDSLPLSCVLAELQGICGVTVGSEVAGSTEIVDVLEIIRVLTSLYERMQEEKGIIFNVPLYVDMCLNWLLNVYDSGRAGKVRLLSMRTGLICLCKADIKEKSKFLFRQVCGADGRSDVDHLRSLLQELIQIPRQLGEVAAFGGSNVEPSVTSCFRMTPGRQSVGESDFLDWMSLEPQAVVWLSVLQRVAQSEHTLHQVRCSICKQSPIRGFRYRSLKHFNMDICQTCFLSGRATKGKTLHDPIIEYYTQSTSGENMRDFAVTLKNKFRSKQYFSRHPQRGYLPVQSAPGPERAADEEQCSLRCQSPRPEPKPLPCSCFPSYADHESQEEFQRMLAMLEEQNRILQGEHKCVQWQYTETVGSQHLAKGSPGSCGSQRKALSPEARTLQQHKCRLETHMQILEDENKQLESELILQFRSGSDISVSTGSPTLVHTPVSRRGHACKQLSWSKPVVEPMGNPLYKSN